MIKTGSTENMYYTCTNHLGTINALVSSTGTIAEEYSTDAWGRRRNPSDWSYTNITTPALINRSYTGHVCEVVFWLQNTHRTTPQQCGEHLDAFGLINMNARLYDPVIGRMLSPDNYLQDAANGQNYNRYTYVLNNPLKFTDPTGNEIVGGAISRINMNYDYSGQMQMFDQFKYDASEAEHQNALLGQELLGGGAIASISDDPFGYTPIGDNSKEAFVRNYYAFRADLNFYNTLYEIMGALISAESGGIIYSLTAFKKFMNYMARNNSLEVSAFSYKVLGSDEELYFVESWKKNLPSRCYTSMKNIPGYTTGQLSTVIESYHTHPNKEVRPLGVSSDDIELSQQFGMPVNVIEHTGYIYTADFGVVSNKSPSARFALIPPLRYHGIPKKF